jgi:hypothetical protein
MHARFIEYASPIKDLSERMEYIAGLQMTLADPADPNVIADAREVEILGESILTYIGPDDPTLEDSRDPDQSVSMSQRELEALIADSIEFGRTLERLQVRAFEKEVFGKQRSIEALDLHNSKQKLEVDRLSAEAIDAIKKTELAYPGRVEDRHFIKTKAADLLGIKVRALNSRLSKSTR